MKTFTSLAGSLGVLLLVVAVLGLGISTVSAAAGTSSSGDITTLHGHGAGHHFTQNSTWQHTMQGTNLTPFHTRGANVNTSAAAFRNTTHEQKGSGFAPNATVQQERLQALVTNLEKNGVDVSALQTAIQNNDTAAEKTWFTTYMVSHKGQAGNATYEQKGSGFAPNATMQQERLQALVTNLEKNGVDVSALQTAIQNNDTAAEKTWLTTYAESHKGQFNNTTRQQWRPWNATVSKSA
jgi:hypothetical protein